MSNNKLPCVNCLTLSICKAKYDQFRSRQHLCETAAFHMLLICITNKCSLVHNYLKYSKTEYENKIALEKFFKAGGNYE